MRAAVRLRADQQLFLSYLLLIAVVLLPLSIGADPAQRRHLLIVGAFAVALAVIFSFFFFMLVTGPVRRIRSAASALAAGDLSRRLRERRRDEFGDLARALDALADELQRRLGQLSDERAEMQTLIDSMSEGVLAIEPSGALRRANPAARRMFALSERAVGIPPEAIARRPEFLQLVKRALGGETSTATEIAGDGRSLLGTAHPLPDGGAVLVFLDVSELRRLEGVRRDFIANASHELKTPLTAIRGYSETLLDPSLPPELTRRFAQIVKDNADRLQRIVDDLLDLSRIESGRFGVEPEEIELAIVAEEAWVAQRADLQSTRVDFAIEIEPGASVVRADLAALRQIFSNLFSNALRYTPPGGRISVTARPARSSRPARGGAGPSIEVAVRDSGSGIPGSHLPRIFERFYRADPARSRIEGGTGLGLAIVKHLVEAHGGHVEAASEVGAGTTITFSLPAS
jgi:signal transduction histidine kinase